MLTCREIEQHAVYLRDELHLPLHKPIGDMPSLISSAGYEYVEDQFGREVSGFCSYLGNEQYLIGFNTEHYFSRAFFRFTLAHELGHLSLPHHREMLKQEMMHRSTHDDDNELEYEANQFAISLLSPRQEFLRLADTQPYTPEVAGNIAAYFGISPEAAARRFITCSEKPLALLYVAHDHSLNRYFSTSFFEEETPDLQHWYLSDVQPMINTFEHSASIELDTGRSCTIHRMKVDYKDETMIMVELRDQPAS